MSPRASLLVLLIAACAGSPNASRDASGEPAESAVTADSMRVLAVLQSSGWSERETLVVEDSVAFAQAWSRVHANASGAPPLPPVDFAAERVAVVGAGTRSSGGYVMMPGSVRVAGDTLVVEVILQTPGAQCGATAALTDPVLVVALRRTSAAPRITMTERAGPSC
jgi:hypothetical protein